MKRNKHIERAECGCVLEGPDEFGNYDLIENPQCEEHGWDVEEAEVTVLPQWLDRDQKDAA